MKRKLFWIVPLMLVGGIAITGCNNSSNNNNSGDESVTLTKKLTIEAEPNKVLYGVGDAFTSEGLKVNVVEMSDGKVISSKPTSEYQLSIEEGTILEEGEQEVFVVANDRSIRSASFKINVRVNVKLGSVYSVVKKMYDTNNYKVENKVGSENDVTCLMTSNALIWDATREAYFADEDYGYGTYKNQTFRYKISNDNKIIEAAFIKDLGSKAKDYGLFDERTVDHLADRRVSNYNMRSITSLNWDYLENDLVPTEENINRYQLDSSQCRWLFNAIGHTSLSFNPGEFLKNILVYVEVKDYGLDVDVIPTSNTDSISGCKAKITNIGTTEIPGMNEFMKNPVFKGQSNVLDKFANLIENDNYRFIYEDDRDVIFTKDYIYGNNTLKDNVINLKPNNKLNKTPGYYSVSVSDTSEVSIGEAHNDTIYLDQFGLFQDLAKYFKIDSFNKNIYRYVINPVKEQTSDLSQFMKLFMNYTTQTIKSVELEFTLVADEIFQVKFSVISTKGLLDSFNISSFGEARFAPIEAKITTLY